jgi:DNA end-binding protein Ku
MKKMRSLWSGSIGFGLVNIPVHLYSATLEHALDLDMLHKEDLAPIRYAKVCKEEGEEVGQDQIVKGYEYEKGHYVILTDDDFENASAAKTKRVDVMSFAKAEEVDANYFEKPYFIEPDQGGEHAYTLLREALKHSKLVGIVRFVIHNREHLGILRPQGDVLMLNQMRFAQELRDTADLKLPSRQTVEPKELEMALSLIDQLTESFKPEKYHDTYAETLEHVIQSKIQGNVSNKTTEHDPIPSKVHDLMSLLKASLNQKPDQQSRHKDSKKRRTRMKVS